MILSLCTQKSSEYDQEIPQSYTADQPNVVTAWTS